MFRALLTDALALSLLLGAEVVVLLVWLANILSVPVPEMVLLRAVTPRGREIVDQDNLGLAEARNRERLLQFMRTAGVAVDRIELLDALQVR